MLGTGTQITWLTVRDCLRQPVCLVLVLISQGMIGLQPILSQFAFREQQKLVTDGVLATIMIVGMLAAILFANIVIARDLESGAASLILAKPVAPATYLLAKTIGILAVLGLMLSINAAGACLSIHIARDEFDLDRRLLLVYYGGIAVAVALGAAANFWRKASFPAVTIVALAIIVGLTAVVALGRAPWHAGPEFGEPFSAPRNLLIAIALVGIAIGVMTLLASLLAVRYTLPTCFVICGFIFFAGLLADYLYARVTQLRDSDVIAVLHNRPALVYTCLALVWTLGAIVFRKKARRHPSLMLELSFHLLCGALVLVNMVISAGAPQIARGMARIVMFGGRIAADFLHAVIPNWQLFWMVDSVAAGRDIPLLYLGYGLIYFALFFVATETAAWLCLDIEQMGRRQT